MCLVCVCWVCVRVRCACVTFAGVLIIGEFVSRLHAVAQVGADRIVAAVFTRVDPTRALVDVCRECACVNEVCVQQMHYTSAERRVCEVCVVCVQMILVARIDATQSCLLCACVRVRCACRLRCRVSPSSCYQPHLFSTTLQSLFKTFLCTSILFPHLTAPPSSLYFPTSKRPTSQRPLAPPWLSIY